MYVYNASLYCDDCGLRILKKLAEQGATTSDDSTEWPIQVQWSESDSPEHCSCGEECCNSENGVGCLLAGVSLTKDGLYYTMEEVLQYLLTGRGNYQVLLSWVDQYNLTLEHLLRYSSNRLPLGE